MLYCHLIDTSGSRWRRSVSASLLARCMSPSWLRSHTYRSPLKVPPAIRAGCSGWNAQLMRQLSTSMLTSALVGLIVSRPKFQVASTPRSSHHPGISWRPYDAATDCPVQLHERHVTTSFLWAAAALDLPRASVSVPKGISSCRQSAGTCTPSTTRVSGSRISCSSSTCFISSCTISRTLAIKPSKPTALTLCLTCSSSFPVCTALLSRLVVWIFAFMVLTGSVCMNDCVVGAT
mmetsp:Transcript_22516/g.67043  ORF Transcript_22516/g.67043 Transcript_22516/m.67043 type:complete len:234 (-) Transcript_22516:584-1285(-)